MRKGTRVDVKFRNVILVVNREMRDVRLRDVHAALTYDWNVLQQTCSELLGVLLTAPATEETERMRGSCW